MLSEFEKKAQEEHAKQFLHWFVNRGFKTKHYSQFKNNIDLFYQTFLKEEKL